MVTYCFTISLSASLGQLCYGAPPHPLLPGAYRSRALLSSRCELFANRLLPILVNVVHVPTPPWVGCYSLPRIYCCPVSPQTLPPRCHLCLFVSTGLQPEPNSLHSVNQGEGCSGLHFPVLRGIFTLVTLGAQILTIAHLWDKK